MTEPTTQEQLEALKKLVEVFGPDKVAELIDTKSLLEKATDEAALPRKRTDPMDEVKDPVKLEAQLTDTFTAAREAAAQGEKVHYAESLVIEEKNDGNKL